MVPNQGKATGVKKMANSETAQGYVQSRMAVPCLPRMPFVPETLNEGLRIRLVHRPRWRLQRWGELGVVVSVC